jgi:hypothetical protein
MRRAGRAGTGLFTSDCKTGRYVNAIGDVFGFWSVTERQGTKSKSIRSERGNTDYIYRMALGSVRSMIQDTPGFVSSRLGVRPTGHQARISASRLGTVRGLARPGLSLEERSTVSE